MSERIDMAREFINQAKVRIELLHGCAIADGNKDEENIFGAVIDGIKHTRKLLPKPDTPDIDLEELEQLHRESNGGEQ